MNHNGKCCLLDARTFSCAIFFCRSQSSNPDSFPKPSPSSNIFTDTNRKGLQKEVAAAFEPLVKAKDNAVNFKEKVSHDNTFRSQSSNHDSFPRPSPPSSIFTNTNRKGLQRDAAAFEPVVKAKDNAVNFKQKVNSGNTFLFENDDDITGPETPGMQPLTSNVKRKVEDVSKLSSLRDSGKRVRFLDDSISLDMTKKELEIASKFEWLDPSRIRDANGRRPDDPLYDRTTLYIPPEVLRKMTASQKQYWSVKCKYMDVLLFFKVVSQSITLIIDILFLYILWYICLFTTGIFYT